jgi:hypothetical protein
MTSHRRRRFVRLTLNVSTVLALALTTRFALATPASSRLGTHASTSSGSASSDTRLARSDRTARLVVACDSMPAYHVLDFWVGDWDVFAGDRKVGTNRIEKVADGCALIENWTDGGGGEGKSLFYYQRVRQDWRQVWVDAGGVKEKHIVARYPDGGVRFQGELPRANGVFVLDRTTLTPNADGTVRQVIEQSSDGGKTWTTGFDAIYRRKANSASKR